MVNFTDGEEFNQGYVARIILASAESSLKMYESTRNKEFLDSAKQQFGEAIKFFNNPDDLNLVKGLYNLETRLANLSEK